MGEKRGDVIYAAFLLLNNGGGIAVKKIWITKGTNRYYEGTYEGNVGEAIILHTENDSKLDGVNLDFSGGKMYYDDDEYTSTDVTIVISKAELYR